MYILNELIKEFREYIKYHFINHNKILIEVDKNILPKISSYIFNNLGALYCTSVGVDERPLNGLFKIYHIFSIDRMNLFIIVASSVDPAIPKMPSIVNDIPAANWAEREIMDLLGVVFDGHSDPRRLVLPDDWPNGVYPLRKDFKYNFKEVARVEKKYPFRKIEYGEYILPIGPYHPALHEPEYFRLYVKRGTIVDAEYRGFGVYRGIEKVAEGRLTYNQIPFIAERICGICGFTHSTCYCQAIESACKIDIPERAEYIRTIMLELERIHSHLLWLGVALHILGFDTGFMYCWRIREPIMDLCELISGNRKTYGLNLIGGVRRDIDKDKSNRVIKHLKELRREFKEFTDSLPSIREVIARIENVGILDRNTARKLSVVGPTARGSGLDRDVRRDHPYAAYKRISFKVPVYSEGDVYARLMVRVEEIFESINIIEHALDSIPEGSIIAENIEFIPKVYGLSATEAPRGENIHFLITGIENRIYRWKVRAPTYNNLPSVPYMLKGENVADAPIIIASIDPCFSCTDRVTIVDLDKKYVKTLSSNEFIKLARRWR